MLINAAAMLTFYLHGVIIENCCINPTWIFILSLKIFFLITKAIGIYFLKIVWIYGS
jgi:hypothetical protein